MVKLELQNYEKNIELFKGIKSNLQKSLSCAETIEHVGSTAIKDMVGKNIIDILVGVKSQDDFEKTFQELKNLGYFPSKNFESNIYHFFASTESETKSGDIHIHLAIIGTERYEDFLTLKNYLQKNPNEAQAYSKHKQELIKNGTTERMNYRAEKSKYVTQLIQRAKQYTNNRY